MTRVVEAIYENGVLKPVEALPLVNRQRVRLVVELIDNSRQRVRAEAFRRLRQRISRSNFSYGGPLPTRDELHDRL